MSKAKSFMCKLLFMKNNKNDNNNNNNNNNNSWPAVSITALLFN